MTRVKSETNNVEGIQPDYAEQPNVDAGPVNFDDAIGYDPKGDEAKRKPDALKPVDFSEIIASAESNVNAVDAQSSVFKSIAALVRAIKGPDDVERLALGLDRAGEYVGRAVLKGTNAETLTGIVGRV